MYKFLSKALLFLVFICASVASLASNFDAQVASVILLQLKPVQKEIGLTEAQRAAMNRYADAHRAKLKAYYQQLGSNGKPNEQKLVSLFESMKSGVIAQLTPAQLRRLREISLQSLDFTALADKTVAAEVGLTASQEARVKETVSVAVTKANEVRNQAISQATADLQGQKPKNDKEKEALYDEANRRAEAATQRVSPQLNQIRERARAQVMAILTPGERAKWQALLGKKFNM